MLRWSRLRGVVRGRRAWQTWCESEQTRLYIHLCLALYSTAHWTRNTDSSAPNLLRSPQPHTHRPGLCQARFTRPSTHGWGHLGHRRRRAEGRWCFILYHVPLPQEGITEHRGMPTHDWCMQPKLVLRTSAPTERACLRRGVVDSALGAVVVGAAGSRWSLGLPRRRTTYSTTYSDNLPRCYC